MNDEFYIGYQDQSPPALAQQTTRVFLAVMVLIAGLATLVASRQTPADPGTFEYGIQRTFEGVLFEHPLPSLRQTMPDGTVAHFLLVGAGKHGWPALAHGHQGEHVRFRGSLIQRGSARMIEMNEPASFESLGKAIDPGPGDRITDLGVTILTGELVDTKCYYGVMRPAVGKVHRACAVRCLSGGIPPGLLVRDREGNATVVLLSGPGEVPLKVNPQWAGRTLRAEGLLTIRGDQPHLKVRRLEPFD